MARGGGNRIGFTGTFDDQVSSKLTGLRKQFDSTAGSPGAKALLFGVGLGAGSTAVGAIGTALSGVIDYASEAIQAGSDLNETVSKSHVVFGDASTQVERFGESAATAFGVSKRAAIEAAASFGNVFTGVDIDQKKAAEMSTTLVKLAGDLASFNNIDPTAALEKLRSGLAGESEPLRSVGVFLTEAQVKAKAMQLGLVDAHGELDEGAKILARYQLILEQTTTAQGDFARTSDGVANTERKLNAEMEDREALVGQKLIPLEKAWLEVRLGIAEGSGHLLNALDAEHHSMEQNLDDARALLNVFAGLGDAVIPLPYEIARFTEAQTDAANAAFRLSENTENVSEAAKDAHPPLSTYIGDQKLLAKYTKDAASATSDLASTIEDELFGKAITAGNEAQLKDNIKDLLKQREETKKGSLPWIELTGQIAENRKALFDLHLEQAAAAGPQAAIDFLRRQKVAAGEAAEKIRDLIRMYQNLQSFQNMFARGSSVTRAGVGGPPPRARGGPVAGGQMYLVNENTPNSEWFIPKRDGWIVPGDEMAPVSPAGGPGGAGGPIVIHTHLHLDGREIADVVSEHQYYDR